MFEIPLNSKEIIYPYLPEGKEIYYVAADNPFIKIAKEFAYHHSLDTTMPTASVVVKGEQVIGIAANGSDYHQTHGCERIRQNIPTGQGYDLCEGCHPKNHSEPKAIKEAQKTGEDITGADLYLWGHWWCCQSCWDAMINAGIGRVLLMENSEVIFNKADKDNIVGKQFADIIQPDDIP